MSVAFDGNQSPSRSRLLELLSVKTDACRPADARELDRLESNLRVLERRLSERRARLSKKAIKIVRLRMETRAERRAIRELEDVIEAARRSLDTFRFGRDASASRREPLVVKPSRLSLKTFWQRLWRAA